MSSPGNSDTPASLLAEGMLAAITNATRAITDTPFSAVIRAQLSHMASTTRSLAIHFARALVQARRDEVGRVIERGIARGDLRADADPDVATEHWLGPVYFRVMFGGELGRHFAEPLSTRCCDHAARSEVT